MRLDENSGTGDGNKTQHISDVFYPCETYNWTRGVVTEYRWHNGRPSITCSVLNISMVQC